MRLLRTTQPPAFYAEQLALQLDDDQERLQAALHDPDSLDLLTWNIFASLATHRDPDWLAYRLQVLGGAELRAPLRISLWTGRDREPLLHPNRAYLAAIRQRGGTTSQEALAAFAQPVEVPVRIEAPDTIVLVDTIGSHYPRGVGGRDRLAEVIDAGLDHAHRLAKTLTVAVLYPSGTRAAAEASARVNELRDAGALRRELPHRRSVEPVLLRELTWERLVTLWQQELEYLELGGQPVKAFLSLLERRGLR